MTCWLIKHYRLTARCTSVLHDRLAPQHARPSRPPFLPSKHALQLSFRKNVFVVPSVHIQMANLLKMRADLRMPCRRDQRLYARLWVADLHLFLVDRGAGRRDMKLPSTLFFKSQSTISENIWHLLRGVQPDRTWTMGRCTCIGRPGRRSRSAWSRPPTRERRAWLATGPRTFENVTVPSPLMAVFT